MRSNWKSRFRIAFCLAGVVLQTTAVGTLGAHTDLPKVPTGHPRVYVQPDDLAAIQAKLRTPEFSATWAVVKGSNGWRPVIDCRRLSQVPGCPPVSSNEPIGPGSSVSSESDTAKLVLAAAYAFASRLPMYVFHSQAGVFGKTRFEDTPAVDSFRHIANILPGDLANWRAIDGSHPESPLTAEGCLNMACNIRGDRIVCIPVGIRPEGLTLTARVPVQLRAVDLLTGKELRTIRMNVGRPTTLSGQSGALIVMGSTISQTGD